jgi:hypothetical protein
VLILISAVSASHAAAIEAQTDVMHSIDRHGWIMKTFWHTQLGRFGWL